MIYCVVGLHDTFLDAYDQPTLVSVPDLNVDVKEMYRRSILSNPEEAYTRFRTHEKDAVYYGTFDDMSGKFDMLEKPKSLFNCASLFPAGFISKKVSQAEEREKQKELIFQAQLKALEKGIPENA